MKIAALLVLLVLGGCTVADRNAVAVAWCERTAGCTTTRNEPAYGPPQVQAMNEPRKKTSKTTEK